MAAAKATLKKLREQPVVERLRGQGQRLLDELPKLFERHDASSLLSVSGHPSWTFLNVSPTAGYDAFNIKTFLMQEWQKRGLLLLGTHNLSYAHSPADLDQLLAMYDEVVPLLVQAVRSGRLIESLNCESLAPLFKLR